MIWTCVATHVYAGIEIVSIPALRRASKSLCLGGRSLPEAYGSRRVCLCVCVWVCHSARYCLHFLRHRGTSRTEMCNASLTQCYLESEFWIRDFVVELWRDLLTLTAVASSPESSEEQIPHNRLLYQHNSSICTTNQMATRVKFRERDCQSYTTARAA